MTANALATGDIYQAIRRRDFRRLWLGSLSASFAMNMQQVARGWFVYELTESAVDLALVTISFTLPQVLLSLPGGVVADRFPKRPILVFSQILNGLATLVMAWIILSGRVEFSHFIVFGVLNGCILALSFPARTAIIPDVIAKRLVFSAIALTTTAMNFARVLAPALAGFLIAWIAAGDTTSTFGVGIVYIVIANLYFVAAISTRLVTQLGDVHENYLAKHPLHDITDGFKYVWKHPSVFALVLISIVPFLFGFPLNTLLPAFNEEVMQGGPEDLGFLLSAMGIGAIIGSLMLAVSGNVVRKGAWLLGSTFVWGLMCVLFGFVSSFVLAAIVIGSVGWLSSFNMAMNRGLLQQKVRPEMFGRVMSIDMMCHGLMPLGILPIGIIADQFGVSIAISVSGAMLILTVGVMYLATPTVRHLLKPSFVRTAA